jgi:hypothetical protein
LSRKRQFFAEFFGENIFKIITSDSRRFHLNNWIEPETEDYKDVLASGTYFFLTEDQYWTEGISKHAKLINLLQNIKIKYKYYCSQTYQINFFNEKSFIFLTLTQ